MPDLESNPDNPPKMSLPDYVQASRQKFPDDFKDWDDGQVARGMLARYPGDAEDVNVNIKDVFGNRHNAIREYYSRYHGVDPELTRRMTGQESGGDDSATSWAGAGGAMQLMPETAKGLGVKDVRDPYQNYEGGTRLFRKLLDQYQDPAKALAAYNTGQDINRVGLDRVRKASNLRKDDPRRGGYVGSTGQYIDNILKDYKGTGYAEDFTPQVKAETANIGTPDVSRETSQDATPEQPLPSQPFVAPVENSRARRQQIRAPQPLGSVQDGTVRDAQGNVIAVNAGRGRTAARTEKAEPAPQVTAPTVAQMTPQPATQPAVPISTPVSAPLQGATVRPMRRRAGVPSAIDEADLKANAAQIPTQPAYGSRMTVVAPALPAAQFTKSTGENRSGLENMELGARAIAGLPNDLPGADSLSSGKSLRVELQSDKQPTQDQLSDAAVKAMGAVGVNEKYRQETGRNIVTPNLSAEDLQYDPQTKTYSFMLDPIKQDYDVVNAYARGGLAAAQEAATNARAEQQKAIAEMRQQRNFALKTLHDTFGIKPEDVSEVNGAAAKGLADTALGLTHLLNNVSSNFRDPASVRNITRQAEETQGQIPEEKSFGGRAVRGVTGLVSSLPEYGLLGASPAGAAVIAYMQNRHRGAPEAIKAALEIYAAGKVLHSVGGRTAEWNPVARQIAARGAAGTAGMAMSVIGGERDPVKIIEQGLPMAAMPIGKGRRSEAVSSGRPLAEAPQTPSMVAENEGTLNDPNVQAGIRNAREAVAQDVQGMPRRAGLATMGEQMRARGQEPLAAQTNIENPLEQNPDSAQVNSPESFEQNTPSAQVESGKEVEQPHYSNFQPRRARNTESGNKGQFKSGKPEIPQGEQNVELPDRTNGGVVDRGGLRDEDGGSSERPVSQVEPQQAQDVLSVLPPEAVSSAEAVGVKQPYEMTREEFIRKHGARIKAVGNGYFDVTWFPDAVDPMRMASMSIKGQVGEKPSAVLARFHSTQVKNGLYRGDDVPAKVLAEYPDLAQKYQKQVAPQTEPPPEIKGQGAKQPYEMSQAEYRQAWYDGQKLKPPADGEQLSTQQRSDERLAREGWVVRVANAVRDGKAVPEQVRAEAEAAVPDLFARHSKLEPEIKQAFDDWNSNRAYIDGRGNYHVKAEGRSSGQIASWNKTVKVRFDKVSDFHDAAKAYLKSPPQTSGNPNIRKVGDYRISEVNNQYRITHKDNPNDIGFFSKDKYSQEDALNEFDRHQTYGESYVKQSNSLIEKPEVKQILGDIENGKSSIRSENRLRAIVKDAGLDPAHADEIINEAQSVQQEQVSASDRPGAEPSNRRAESPTEPARSGRRTAEPTTERAAAEPTVREPSTERNAGAGNTRRLRSLPSSLEQAGLEGGADRFYDVKSNLESENKARVLIKDKGVDSAIDWVKQGKEPSAEQSAVGVELIKGLSRDPATLSKAVDVASTLAEKSTAQGQAIQYYATLAKESPEGALLAAQRVVSKRSPDTQLTPEAATEVTEIAKKLQDSEAKVATLEKQIEELSKPRTGRGLRPKLATFQEKMTAVAEEARARLKERQAGREQEKAQGIEYRHSGLPVIDAADLKDLTIIGAAKIAKGGIRFAEWSAEMVKEFGESVKPHLNQLFSDSYKMVDEQRKTESQSRAERSAQRAGATSPEDVESLIAQKRAEQARSRQARADLARTFTRLQKGELRDFTERALGTLNRNALLTPRGMEKILAGMTGKQAADAVARVIESPIDAVVSKTRGTPRTAGGLTVKGLTRASIDGAVDGAKNAYRALRGRQTQFMEAEQPLTGIKPLDAALNSMQRLYSAKENALRSYAYNESIQRQARVLAANDLKDGTIKRSELDARTQEYVKHQPVLGVLNSLVAASRAETQADYDVAMKRITKGMRAEQALKYKKNISDLMNSIALRESDEQVYAEPSKISERINRIASGLGTPGQVAKNLYLPFMRRPSNSIVDFFQTYIGAPLNIPYRAIQMLSKPFSAESQSNFAKAASRGLVGYGIMSLGYYLSSTGNMHNGNLVVSGKEYPIWKVPFIGWLLGIGSVMHEQGMSGAALQAGKQVKEHPLLRGLEGAGQDVEAVAGVLKGDVKALGRRAMMRGGDWASRLIPQPLPLIAETSDNQQRVTNQGVLQKSESRIPFLRQTLPAYADKSYLSIFDPLYQSATQPRSSAVSIGSPAQREATRLNLNLGDSKQGEKESTENFTKRKSEVDPLVDSATNTLMRERRYGQLSDEDKKKVFSDVVRRVRENDSAQRTAGEPLMNRGKLNRDAPIDIVDNAFKALQEKRAKMIKPFERGVWRGMSQRP